MSSQYRSDPDFEPFDDVMEVLDQGPLEIASEPLSEALWSRISAGIDEADTPGDFAAAPGQISAVETPSVAENRVQVPDSDARTNSITELDSRRSSTYAVFGVAAAAVVLVALTLAWQSSRTVPADFVAQLDELEDFTGGQGTATLRGTSLEVEVGELEASEDVFHEVWAIHLDGGEIEGLVSLGRVEDSSEFDWPDNVDPEVYSTIDVSIEPNDGNPEHSGDSVLRGELAG